MRGVLLVGLVAVGLGCDNTDGTDAGVDGAVVADGSTDSGTDAASLVDAGPPLCESSNAGCFGACQLIHDCVAESSISGGGGVITGDGREMFVLRFAAD